MSGGVYSALSGMRTRLEQLDRLAADLANVNTSGYKVARAGTLAAQRDFETALESAVDVMAGDARTDFSPGVVATTGRELDVAVGGRGFFVIDTPAGPRYTRDGAFTRRADGVLATTRGEPVLGVGGEITLTKGQAVIEPDGTVKAGGVVAGRLEIVEFESDADLVRESGARFVAIAGAEPVPSDATLMGGALEQSNASVVDIMARITEVSRDFDSLQRGSSSIFNELDGRAIVALGRQ